MNYILMLQKLVEHNELDWDVILCYSDYDFEKLKAEDVCEYVGTYRNVHIKWSDDCYEVFYLTKDLSSNEYERFKLKKENLWEITSLYFDKVYIDKDHQVLYFVEE